MENPTEDARAITRHTPSAAIAAPGSIRKYRRRLRRRDAVENGAGQKRSVRIRTPANATAFSFVVTAAPKNASTIPEPHHDIPASHRYRKTTYASNMKNAAKLSERPAM